MFSLQDQSKFSFTQMLARFENMSAKKYLSFHYHEKSWWARLLQLKGVNYSHSPNQTVLMKQLWDTYLHRGLHVNTNVYWKEIAFHQAYSLKKKDKSIRNICISTVESPTLSEAIFFALKSALEPQTQTLIFNLASKVDQTI